MPSIAGDMLIEDKLKSIIHRDKNRGIKYEKANGLVPMGQHSPFGDFPDDYMPTKSYPKKLKPILGREPGPRQPPVSKSQVAGYGRFAHAPAPPLSGAFKRRSIPPTDFRKFYDRGDVPIQIKHGAVGGKINWKIEIENIDYHHYLPIFFDGLREKEDPYRFLALEGATDLVEFGGIKLLPVLPQLIIPLKTALNTRDHDIMVVTLKILNLLVTSCDCLGEALVPYYRQLLPVLNIFKNKNNNLGDKIDYGQRKKRNIGEMIEETLHILEMHGGENAFVNIKYMIPTYESCCLE